MFNLLITKIVKAIPVQIFEEILTNSYYSDTFMGNVSLILETLSLLS